MYLLYIHAEIPTKHSTHICRMVHSPGCVA